MDTIGLHIDYLLLHHACVTLPGLGSLLRHSREAVYDNMSGCWLPPTCVISFNPDITRTDGMLARSIARREGLADNAGARKVELGVGEIRRRLDTDGRVSLGHAGVLSVDGRGSLCFEPWTPRGAWLPAVHPACADSGEAVTASQSPVRRRRAGIYRRVARIAACIAVTIALGWIAAYNIRYGGERQYASVAPVHPTSVVSLPGQATAPVVWHIRHHADASVEVEPRQAMTVAVTDAPGYYLVVASLATKDEAMNFIRNHPGRELSILNTEGRFRVYVAQAPTAAPLYSAALSPEITRDFPASWVCRR